MAILRRSRRWILAAAVFLLTSPGRPGQAQRSLEYEVKAEFIYKFTQYIDWPAGAWTAPGEPFRACIVGADPFGALMDRAVKNEKYQGHPFVVERFAPDANLNRCQIVFLAAEETRRAAAVLKGLTSTSALTIGESPDFLPAGGAMAFAIDDGGHVRFDINLRAPHIKDLHVSSKLLRVAREISRVERP